MINKIPHKVVVVMLNLNYKAAFLSFKALLDSDAVSEWAEGQDGINNHASQKKKRPSKSKRHIKKLVTMADMLITL